MELLNNVYENYLSTRQLGKVPGTSTLPDIVAIRSGLREKFLTFIDNSGRDRSIFRAYGKVGEINFNFAKVPWTAVCSKTITKSVRQGYYIVLLFCEDMSGCYLSLNQGYTDFYTTFGTDELAAQQIQMSAQRAADLVEIPDNFVTGKIDLRASNPLGMGYERGAIASKYYERSQNVIDDEFREDFLTLLQVYEQLENRVGPNLVNALPLMAEEAFQGAVELLAGRQQRRPNPTIPPPGPAAPAPLIGMTGRTGYRRNVNVSASAIARAQFRCEVDPDHLTFISNMSNENFVEAHHLIPMQFQGDFAAGLDVPENVVALCPNCHRMVHHGRTTDKLPILRHLLDLRVNSLVEREIRVSFEQLRTFYSAEILE